MRRSSRLGTLTLLILPLTFLCACLSVPASVEASLSVFAESDVALIIAEAQQKIIICYHVVTEADTVGANVTALLARLNEAGWQLSRAQQAYELGDFDSATYHASLSQEWLDGFVIEAEELREMASEQHYWGFLVNVVGSIAATLVVMCGSCVVWILLKRRPEKI